MGKDHAIFTGDLDDMKRSKIAVCLSGQARTWRYCVENIRKYFETHYDVDYFISTWDMDTWRGFGKWDDEPSDTQGLQEAYDAKSCRILPYVGYQGKTWYGMMRSMELSMHDKRMHECENNMIYDAVVKCRLDVIFPPHMAFWYDRLEPMTLYTNNFMERAPREFYGANVSDIYFVGTSHVMDVIGDCLRMGRAEDHQVYGPGVQIWRHAARHNIHTSNLHNMPQWIIMRREFITLDPKTQYNELLMRNNQWKH